MRVAIVHDYLNQRGGAERVCLALHRAFPTAPIFTSLYDPASTYGGFSGADVRTTFLQRFAGPGVDARRLFLAYPSAFASLRLDEFDLVLSSSTGWAHAVKTPGGRHLCYCHNPARWLYQTADYLRDGGPVPAKMTALARPLLSVMRRWDQRAARRPDRYVANSGVVRERIRRVYGREATVVYPPVDIDRFRSSRSPNGCGDFYLVVSRLLTYKRIDLAIGACRELGRRLVIVGRGPDEGRLRAMAGGAVELAGVLRDVELTDLLQGCIGLIQAGEEDLGLAPIEANAAGRPVVAFAAGGALETVAPMTTGVLFHEQSSEALAKAMVLLEENEWSRGALLAHASRFSEERFQSELHILIDQEPAWPTP